MDKRYLIFISSTYEDLKDERENAISAVLELNHIPAGMEQFPSVGIPPMDLIKKVLKGCDYYILIIGARYGSLSRSGISYTEEEYDYAKSLGIPIIAFFPSNPDSFPISRTDRDDSKRRKLEAFKEKVINGGITISYWKNADRLHSLILSSIPRAINYQPRTGWVRADTIPYNNDKVLDELNELRDYKNKSQSELNAASERLMILENKLNGWKASLAKPFTVGNVTFRMVYIVGGSFIMGTTKGQGIDALINNKPTYHVTVNDFWIGETQVTQALWAAVTGTNPSRFIGNTNHPVEQVSFANCQSFIKKLNDKFKDQLAPMGLEFRLPTEAEWEFAARGGNVGKDNDYAFAGSNNIDEVAWYNDNRTHPVAEKMSNELGLYDMSGNVWERCLISNITEHNEYGENQSALERKETFALCRGGSWSNQSSSFCKVSYRGRNTRMGFDNVGLRLALSYSTVKPH